MRKENGMSWSILWVWGFLYMDVKKFFSPIMYYLYDIFCGRRASMCMEEKLVCLLFFKEGRV